ELDVARSHEHVVEPPAVETAEDTQEHAGRARYDHGDEADDERHAGAVEEAAQDVAAEGVRAERMRCAAARAPHGWGERLQQIVLDRIGGGGDKAQKSSRPP